MVGGRSVATWALTRDKVTLSPFASMSKKDASALDADAAAVVEFLS
jgi:hypothetical protein